MNIRYETLKCDKNIYRLYHSYN